jgi:hypothetical protein
MGVSHWCSAELRHFLKGSGRKKSMQIILKGEKEARYSCSSS